MKKPSKPAAAAAKPKAALAKSAKSPRPMAAKRVTARAPAAKRPAAARPRTPKPIRIGTASLTGPGRAQGMLKVAELPDGYPIEIPVLAVRGRQAGPTIWLHGCVHGNEYCGAYILHSF